MKMKRILVESINKDVVLAKSVVLKDGTLIYIKGRTTTVDDIEFLTKNKIKWIYVESNSENEKEDASFEDDIKVTSNNRRTKEKEIDVPEEVYTRDKPEFKRFVKLYAQKVEAVKECFFDFLDGKELNVSGLFDNAISILDEIKCKSDIISYFHHLKITDDYTYYHSLNVSILCYLYAEWSNMSYEEQRDLTIAGILHDIGKVKINSAILDKPHRLTKEEFDEVKKHTVYGYALLKNENVSERVKLAALMHHEKVDGSGYPAGLVGEKIEEFAKIVTVCDIYDAMTSNRAYHEGKCPFDVLKDFEQNCYGSLDITNVITFCKHVAYSYLGDKVLLSNDKEGEVVFINPTSVSKPIIKVGEDFIDLYRNSDIYIQALI